MNHLMLNKIIDEVNKRARAHQCRQCGKSFRSDKSLRAHRMAKGHNVVFHYDNEKKSVYRGNLLRCNTCNMSFDTVRERAMHESKEHKQ